MSLAFRFVIQSNVGVIRKSNEDCGLGSTKLIAVADGMGGHAAGEVASSTVIQTFKDELDSLPQISSDFSSWLIETTNLAHASIGDLIAADPEKRGMGTTFSTIAAVNDKIGIGHIGDSRIYRLSRGDFQQISVDHTYVQSLVDSGEITQAEAAVHPRRNLLIRAIDGIHEVAVDVDLIEVQLGDRFLLCSDGLTGVISDVEISKQLAKPDLTIAVAQLIEMALAAGAPDNVTIAACEVINNEELLVSGSSPIVVGAVEEIASPKNDSPTSNRPLWLKIAAVILLVISGFAIGNSWLNSQWYVSISNGNVAIFQGINQNLGPIKFQKLSFESDLPASTLTTNDFSLVTDGVSISDLNSGLILIDELWSRSTICATAPDGCNP